MRPRIARTFLTLLLLGVLSLGMVGQAGAYLSPNWGDNINCGSNKVGMTSYGTGTVSHSINGQFQGSWYNGTTFQYRTTYSHFPQGYWLAWSSGGHIDTWNTYGFCY